MRSCVQCEETAHFDVAQARIPNYEFANSVVPLTLTSHYGDFGETGLFGRSKSREGIEMSARVCRGCGLVSWYVRDLEKLAEFAERGLGGVSRTE